MKKIIVSILFLLSITVSVQAQTTGVEKQMFKANLLLTPGLEYEVGVGDRSTLDFRLGTGFAYVQVNDESDYGIFLTFEGAYRYYFNFEKRSNQGKKVTGNSGDYIALTTAFSNADPIIGDLEVDSDYLGVVGPVWGFQRTYNSGFNLGLELGVGYAFDNNDGYIAPLVGFRLGWAFGS